MVTPHLPPEQAAVALLPVMLGDTLAARDVATSYLSHPAHAPGESANRRVTYVPRRGAGRFNRSKAGAVAAGARMAIGARESIASADLVHLHSNGLLIEVCAWLARRFSKPYIVTLYGTDVSAHDPVRNARYGRVVRDADARVYYSRGLRDLGARAGLTPEPSTVIYAPVSADFRAVGDGVRASLRRQLGAGRGPVLLTVKHLRPVGGHDTLLKAIPAVLLRHPDATFWLAGDGNLREPLESMCRELGIASNVRFLGRVANDAIWQYYAAADLFVLPSHVESWGTVMLESIVCGTPVVTTDTVGGREVGEAVPGAVTVVPRGDSNRLAEAISALLTRPHRVPSVTLDRVTREFSVASCASQYLQVYQETLAAGR